VSSEDAFVPPAIRGATRSGVGQGGRPRLSNWRLEAPSDAAKMVVAVAPHTSNWDFVHGAAAMFALDLRVAFIGKHTIFVWPFSMFFKWMGGIPVDRSAARGVGRRSTPSRIAQFASSCAGRHAADRDLKQGSAHRPWGSRARGAGRARLGRARSASRGDRGRGDIEADRGRVEAHFARNTTGAIADQRGAALHHRARPRVRLSSHGSKLQLVDQDKLFVSRRNWRGPAKVLASAGLGAAGVSPPGRFTRRPTPAGFFSGVRKQARLSAGSFLGRPTASLGVGASAKVVVSAATVGKAAAIPTGRGPPRALTA
jgi:hypothetical protein